jgi:hypothetical protein
MRSYEKFNYLLRPAKQVERKLLIEGLHQLAAGGFHLRRYRYVGFGSPFYADFALFHKYLYIDDCWCVEHMLSIEKRMRFNRPFSHVRLHMCEVSEIVARLDRDRKHLVWLDYDFPLTDQVLGDVAGFATTLAAESIIIVTVEADPRVQADLPAALRNEVTEYRRQRVETEIGHRATGGVKKSDITFPNLPQLYARVIVEALQDEIALRSRSLRFIPLFNFSYADGRQMLSVGGMIGGDAVKRRVQESGVYSLPFVTARAEPVPIVVPPLTARERLWLDQNPKARRLKRPFEIQARVATAYSQYYRQYPSYFEALL